MTARQNIATARGGKGLATDGRDWPGGTSLRGRYSAYTASAYHSEVTQAGGDGDAGRPLLCGALLGFPLAFVPALCPRSPRGALQVAPV